MIGQIHAVDRDYKSALSYTEKAAAYAKKNEGEMKADSHWNAAANIALEMDDMKTALAAWELPPLDGFALFSYE